MNINDKEFDMLDEVISSIYKRGLEDGSADVKARVKGAYEKGLEDAWECARKILDAGVPYDYWDMGSGHHISYAIKRYSASEAMQKIKEYEERQKRDERKVDCEVTACYNCVNHNDCDYEYEKKQKQNEKSCGTCKHVMLIDCGAYPCNECPRDTLPKWEQQASAKDCKKCTKEISAECVVDGCEFEPKKTDDGSIKVGDEVRIKGSDPIKDDCDYGICTRSLPNVNTIYVMRRDGSSGEENKDEWYRTGRTFPQIAEVLEKLRE